MHGTYFLLPDLLPHLHMASPLAHGSGHTSRPVIVHPHPHLDSASLASTAPMNLCPSPWLAHCPLCSGWLKDPPLIYLPWWLSPPTSAPVHCPLGLQNVSVQTSVPHHPPHLAFQALRIEYQPPKRGLPVGSVPSLLLCISSGPLSPEKLATWATFLPSDSGLFSLAWGHHTNGLLST